MDVARLLYRTDIHIRRFCLRRCHRALVPWCAGRTYLELTIRHLLLILYIAHCSVRTHLDVVL